MNYPGGIAVDRADSLLIADSWNSRIRRVARLETITTVAGTGERGLSGDNGPAVDAQLNGPDGLALDASGNLFIGDARNHRIRILTQTRPADTLPAPTNLTATTVSSSRIDLIWRDNSHDGDTGQLVRTVNQLTVPARGWRQVNRILAQYAPGTRQGYVQVRQTSGNNPFIAYGVINDGSAPGRRSGDGALLPSQK